MTTMKTTTEVAAPLAATTTIVTDAYRNFQQTGDRVTVLRHQWETEEKSRNHNDNSNDNDDGDNDTNEEVMKNSSSLDESSGGGRYDTITDTTLCSSPMVVVTGTPIISTQPLSPQHSPPLQQQPHPTRSPPHHQQPKRHSFAMISTDQPQPSSSISVSPTTRNQPSQSFSVTFQEWLQDVKLWMSGGSHKQ